MSGPFRGVVCTVCEGRTGLDHTTLSPFLCTKLFASHPHRDTIPPGGSDNDMFTNLLGYPTKWGNKNAQTIDWQGNDYYIDEGVEFPASNFGWGGFDSAYGGISQSGLYRAEFQFQGSGAQQSVYIHVYSTT